MTDRIDVQQSRPVVAPEASHRLDALFRQHHAALTEYAATLTDSPADVDDVVGESWLRAVSAPSIPEDAYTWLRATVADVAGRRTPLPQRPTPHERDGRQPAPQPARPHARTADPDDMPARTPAPRPGRRLSLAFALLTLLPVMACMPGPVEDDRKEISDRVRDANRQSSARGSGRR